MYMAVRGNLRTAAAALTSFKGALEIAFRAGAVSGMFTVGLGLLGATVIFLLFREKAMFVLVGFGFGGSLAALFMRVGGGFTPKARMSARTWWQGGGRHPRRRPAQSRHHRR
jgi:K(+)-stimulated pyrophosphate-energized sodium pump